MPHWLLACLLQPQEPTLGALRNRGTPFARLYILDFCAPRLLRFEDTLARVGLQQRNARMFARMSFESASGPSMSRS